MPGQQDMRTPKWLFNYLNGRYGPFRLDAFASPHNALCKNFLTEKEDGFIHPWDDPTFANSPFKRFCECIGHAYLEWKRRAIPSCLVGPTGCSQSWFHKWASKGIILVPNKRINFLMPDGTPTKNADRDTMIYIFGHGAPLEGRFRVEPLDVKSAMERFS